MAVEPIRKNGTKVFAKAATVTAAASNPVKFRLL